MRSSIARRPYNGKLIGMGDVICVVGTTPSVQFCDKDDATGKNQGMNVRINNPG